MTLCSLAGALVSLVLMALCSLAGALASLVLMALCSLTGALASLVLMALCSLAGALASLVLAFCSLAGPAPSSTSPFLRVVASDRQRPSHTPEASLFKVLRARMARGLSSFWARVGCFLLHATARLRLAGDQLARGLLVLMIRIGVLLQHTVTVLARTFAVRHTSRQRRRRYPSMATDGPVVSIVWPPTAQILYLFPTAPIPSDPACNGALHPLALDACDILFPGPWASRQVYLSRDPEGTQPVPLTMRILPANTYYLQLRMLRARSAKQRLAMIDALTERLINLDPGKVPTFESWPYSHELPPHWGSEPIPLSDDERTKMRAQYTHQLQSFKDRQLKPESGVDYERFMHLTVKSEDGRCQMTGSDTDKSRTYQSRTMLT
ncbi:hypothetical protein LXA43DRAFT_1102828 [Ganoderma leucocontextum]|nr:hypothetical protein LXA43DRAFT_1102828 [Ganoderma leucocontextum]